MKTMKTLFTNEELKKILCDLDIAYIDMDGSEVHRQEGNNYCHDFEIFANVLCMRETLREPYESYDHKEDGVYRYSVEIDDICAYFDNEECISKEQIENVILPILEDKIDVYG